MKSYTKFIPIMILLAMSTILTSWDILDNAKKKIKSYTQEVLGEEEKNDLITSKLDTLEATVKVFEKHGLDNQKFYNIVNMHLRIALELHYVNADLPSEEHDRFYKLTGGWCGGHPFNKNWVSAFSPYDEGLDYEYTDYVYPFDESNPLPTAHSKSDDILDGLLK